jgi:hypothetical protein
MRVYLLVLSHDTLTTAKIQCTTCPDSSNCARQLEEKWRQAYHAVFRFGAYASLLSGDFFFPP